MGGFLLIGAVILMGGLLWSAVSCIQGGATARLEATSLARAIEVKDADHATERRLHAETKDKLGTLQESTDEEIASIRAAEARAKAEAEAHAERADAAEAHADRALALADELAAQEPVAPQPGDPCPLLCTPPELSQ